MTETVALPREEELLHVARDLAHRGAKTALRHFRNPLKVSYKGDQSPVTVADRETELEMRTCIEAHFPGHGIFGEEHGQANMDRDVVWVLDPIDGTKSFISGNPLFGMLVSVLVRGTPEIGMIHMPALKETFLGGRGHGASHNGAPIQTRPCQHPAEAVCFIGEGDKMLDRHPGLYEKLTAATRLTRFGYDCYPYGQLAMGQIDIVIECGLQPYDYLALIPIIEGAGGTITDWSGAPLTLNSSGDVIACGSRTLHRQMLDLIRE